MYFFPSNHPEHVVISIVYLKKKTLPGVLSTKLEYFGKCTIVQLTQAEWTKVISVNE